MNGFPMAWEVKQHVTIVLVAHPSGLPNLPYHFLPEGDLEKADDCEYEPQKRVAVEPELNFVKLKTKIVTAHQG